MADGKVKISELTQAMTISDNAVFPYSQDNGGTDATFKAPMTQIARKVNEDMDFTNLHTSSKQVVGAINQTLNNFAEEYDTTQTYNSGDPVLYAGVLYKCNSNNVTGAWDSTKWDEAKAVDFGGGGGSGSGGHTIVDDSGTSLSQRTNLQFKGAYSEDNSTDNTTEVNVVRGMTKAEFDELTEAEKVGLINVTDITGGNDDRFQPVIYSEDEREIGVWTDGKPLYQKTVSLTNITIAVSGGYSYDISSWSVDTIVKNPEGFITLSNDTDLRTVPFGILGSYATVVTATKSAISFSRIGGDLTCNRVVFTLVYTKTTDQAGSGQWTPQGVPAVHYSTDERVVGTWIDGSTLYEKTIVGDSTYDQQFNYIPHGVANLDKIIDYFGYCIYASNEFSLIPYLRGTTYMTVTTWDSTNVRVEKTGLSSSFTGVRLVIRYTKSST